MRKRRDVFNNVRVKVLQLKNWMKKPDHHTFPKLKTKVPRFNRDGYYLHYDICWFEYNGIAYIYNAKSFLYTLNLLGYNILSKKEKDAINLLKVMGLASKGQLRMVQKSKQLMGLRNIYRHFLTIKMEFKK